MPSNKLAVSFKILVTENQNITSSHYLMRLRTISRPREISQLCFPKLRKEKENVALYISRNKNAQ
jgi:hypothetical protein